MEGSDQEHEQEEAGDYDYEYEHDYGRNAFLFRPNDSTGSRTVRVF
jgi:hypothetical protein